MIWLAHSGLGLAMLISLYSSALVFGLCKYSTMIPRSRLSTADDVSLANLLASSFCLHGTLYMLKYTNWDFSFTTIARYYFIHSSFASYSPCTCPTTSWESLLTLTLLALSALERHSPMSIASYSTSLLVALNLNLMAYSSLFISGVTKTTPPLAALLVEKPSTCIIYSS